MKRLLALTLVLAACTSIAATPLEQAKAAAERGDFKEAVRIWTEQANAGDAKAQYNLAIMHYYGEETGLPTDDAEVRALLEKVAADNIPEAQYHLALLLLDAKHGLNITALNKTPVTDERKRGVELLSHAAEAGVAEAQAMLAALYHHGVKDVLEKDNGKHIAWQEKAAEKIAYTAY
ncbi:MAG: tetratricopeptide repeat protein, partial [Cardiobacterium sp.]